MLTCDSEYNRFYELDFRHFSIDILIMDQWRAHAICNRLKLLLSNTKLRRNQQFVHAVQGTKIVSTMVLGVIKVIQTVIFGA